jgi:hypothetical protein
MVLYTLTFTFLDSRWEDKRLFIVSIKQNVNFKFQPAAMFVFFRFSKKRSY